METKSNTSETSEECRAMPSESERAAQPRGLPRPYEPEAARTCPKCGVVYDAALVRACPLCLLMKGVPTRG
jgi:hypothetical protein